MSFKDVTFYGNKFNRAIVKEGVKIGEGTRIGEFTVIGANAKIGKNCRILYHVTICKDAMIGDNVFIAPNTSLLNDKYPPSKVSVPPIIEDNVVIGGGCIINPGVRIEKNAVIASGSVITHNVPFDWVVIRDTPKPHMYREDYEAQKSLWEHVHKVKP